MFFLDSNIAQSTGHRRIVSRRLSVPSVADGLKSFNITGLESLDGSGRRRSSDTRTFNAPVSSAFKSNKPSRANSIGIIRSPKLGAGSSVPFRVQDQIMLLTTAPMWIHG